MNQGNLSCDLSMPMLKPKPELEQTAETLGITPEKLKSMREYAAKLKKKFPRMKDNRIQRKVAEQFKIKLT